MRSLHPRRFVFAAAGLILLGAGTVHAEKISYNFQIKPILAEHCFKCHGQDEKQRKADLRVDDRASMLALGAIEPGNPDMGTLIERIITTDESEIMPPPEEHKPLSKDQITLIKQWLAEGANYEKHWAFIPPKKPDVPVVTGDTVRIGTPVDNFIVQKLKEHGFNQSQAASREAWLRRVTFDLTGLPPTLEEQDAFLADADIDATAKQKVVKRLMGAQAYGEHMAVGWLDVARFADTYGRHEDHNSLTWPYRDWVIRAFNQNLPFDKFVMWQTAGDMMEAPTQDMYLATVFNRLPQQSNEAGSNEEEFRQEIVADRVNTNSTALLGLSMECARCHDHKYDPISTKEYYSMAAFLNNIDESGLYTVYTENIPAPSMFVYDGDDERIHAELKLKIRLKEAQLEAAKSTGRRRFEGWLNSPLAGSFSVARPLVHLPFDGYEEKENKTVQNVVDASKPGTLKRRTDFEEGHFGQALYLKADNEIRVEEIGQYSRTQPFSFSIWLKPTESQKRAVAVHYSRAGMDAGSQGYEMLIEDDYVSFALCHFWPGNAVRIKSRQKLVINAWTQITVTYDGSSRAAGMNMFINGFPAATEVVCDNLYKDIRYDDVFSGKDAVHGPTLTISGRHNDNSLVKTYVDDFMFWDRELTAVEARLVGNTKSETHRPEEWFDWWLRDKDPVSTKLAQELRALRDEENEVSMRMKEVMVMRERPEKHRRETYVLERGHFEAIGEKVQPGTPAAVFDFPEDLERTRLGYARWLVDRRNPLTARVYVNRMWQQFFGQGIVATSEDFGVQGQLPSHPELLDWLSVWFMENGWDVKALCEMIVMSATYGQEAVDVDKAQAHKDPNNTWLSRGPRQRLTAEQLRDNVLAVSGLLVRKIGGPPTKPYQPAGLWEDSGTQHSYEQDSGESLFRRSCYTFWRRTLPPPSMTIFDAPTREFCKSRRDRSSTPLQALVLFNDPQYLEASRVLAENLIKKHPNAGDDAARIHTAFRLLAGREPTSRETEILAAMLADQRAFYQSSPDDAEALRRKNGEAAVDTSLPAIEVAATTMLTRALLGYDDCVIKP